MPTTPTIRIDQRLVNLHTSYNKHTPTRMLAKHVGQCHCGLLVWVASRVEVAWFSLYELIGKETHDNLADINAHMAYLKANPYLLYGLEPEMKDSDWYIQSLANMHKSLLNRAEEYRHAQKR